MQAQLVPASRGWRWLADGWKLFRTAPLMWLVMVFAYYILMTVVSVIPVVGVVAAMVIVPALSVGFMAASRAVERGQAIAFSLLFDGFRANRAALIRLGFVYFACVVLLLGASAIADGGGLARWFLTGQRPPVEVMQSGAFLHAMLLATALYMPVMMLFWFSPTLCAWRNMPAGKSLFFSFFACVLNWRAFVAYGISTSLVLFVAPFFTLLILMLASGGSLRPAALSVLFPFVLAMMPTLFASFYASFRDVFSDTQPEPLLAAEGEPN